MTDKEKSDQEISINKDGVTLKGDIVDEIRKPLRRASDTADSILRLIDNIVGLPSDFVSHHLEHFRDKYREEIEQIPNDNFQNPPYRTGCAVLRHVAYSVEEPEIQDLFAKLLATASDKTKANKAHPSFASVINDLTADEARVLLALGKHGRTFNVFNPVSSYIARTAGVSEDSFVICISNLLRLGLIEKEIKQRAIPREKLERISMRSRSHNPRDIEEFFNSTNRAINELKEINGSLMAIIQEQRLDMSLRISMYGKQFLEACIE